MTLLGNILWFIFGGFLTSLSWFFLGLLWSITIIGLPVGMQCFKFARLSLSPFGKDIIYENSSFSLIINILWLVFGGIELAFAEVLMGICLCITIVGIPFGLQHFKLAKLALMPLGAKIVSV